MFKNYAIAIHGGAGTILKKNMTKAQEKAYTEKLKEAIECGFQILKNGGSAIDATEASVMVLEDSPLFNAGKGSVFNHSGTHEMDAAIMDGKTLKAGAIAGISKIKNPIQLAKLVMNNSQHILLIGKGAEKFAKQQKIELVDNSYFYDETRFHQLQKIKNTRKTQLDHDLKDDKFGTVGAVAIDKFGNLAAATSTGGMTNKMYGRVGDSPIIGAGTYANNTTCAISCTGHGEYFIRNVVAYDVSALMEYKKMDLEEASNCVIHHKLKEMGGYGGLIAIDNKGNICMPFNTDGMYRGFQSANKKAKIFIYK